MKTFRLTIAKLGENLFDGEAVSVTLPGVEGEFEVLAGHEAFVSELRAGTACIRIAEGKIECFALPADGIAEISNNQATILL